MERKTKKEKYLEEATELITECSRLMNHHISRLLLKYSNDLWKLASKHKIEEFK